MLYFTTEKIDIRRKVTTWIKKDYTIIETDIEIDIQPYSQETLWLDVVSKWFKWFISTNNKNLIQYNDEVISQLDWLIYTVKWIEFFKWIGKLPDSLEIYLTLNETE